MRCLLLLPVLASVSCTGLPRGWRAARRSVPADAVSGAWSGTWTSRTNGHHGGLRAVVERREGDTWNFRYRASWGKILCAGFSMEAQVQNNGPDRPATVSGSLDLGRAFGGVFTSSGTISGGILRADYHSSMDHGVMVLRRLNSSP